jgi:glyoxylase-like metal-dependent hydrolase (beta-lactamase superfamily II)/tetratricopeptide (TPR) repeat protein
MLTISKRAVLAGLTLVSILASRTALLGRQEEDLDKTLRRLAAANEPYAKGLDAYKKGRLDKAESAFGSCIEKFPGHAYAHYYAANIRFVRKDFAAALASMELALAHFDGMTALSARLEERRSVQRDAARLALDEMSESGLSCRDSRSVEWTLDELDADEFTSERSAARREEAFARMKARYVYFHGNVLFRLQRVPEAFRRYEEAVRLDPRQADAYNNLIAICLVAREYRAAEAFLEKAEAAGLGESLNLELKERLFKALGKPTEGILFEDLEAGRGPDRLGVRRFVLTIRPASAEGRPGHANAYVVFSPGSREAVLIDPGAEDARIGQFVREKGLRIKAVLNTHAHLDHCAANAFYAKEFGAPVYVPRDEARYYSAPPDRLLGDGDSVECGGLSIRVVQIAGHTEGSLCFLVEGAVFSGDTLFKNDIGAIGAGGAGKRDETRKKMVRAIRAKLLGLPDDTLVCSGHGRTSTIGAEKTGNPALAK